MLYKMESERLEINGRLEDEVSGFTSSEVWPRLTEQICIFCDVMLAYPEANSKPEGIYDVLESYLLKVLHHFIVYIP